VAGEKPRPGLIHEQPAGIEKTACNYDYIEQIWPELDWYLQDRRLLHGRANQARLSPQLLLLRLHRGGGQAVRMNPADEVVAEMRQLYDRGVRNFWFTDAQFIPARRFMRMPRNCCKKSSMRAWNDIHWAAYIRADNITRNWPT
jgi:hypothetical protein